MTTRIQYQPGDHIPQDDSPGLVAVGPVDVRNHDGITITHSEPGRTRGVLACPFCAEELTVFLWSFASTGKRCRCGALITPRAAIQERPARSTP